MTVQLHRWTVSHSSPERAARVLLGAEGGVLAAVHRLEVVAGLGHGHHGRGRVPAPPGLIAGRGHGGTRVATEKG